ncbi:MAG: tetratricopeptide repeat protein [Patescibacteria group bacterium]
MDNDPKNRFQEIFLDSWRPFFWIALIVFLVYSATLSFNIVYLDDNVLVAGDYSYNKDLSNLPQAFKEDIFRTSYQGGSYYRPILRTTFMLDAQFGENAIIFMSHLTNLLLHIFAVYLLFLLLIKFGIKKETALWLSLIFGIHPLTAQTVSFIPGRNDSLLAIFVFPALWFFVDYLQTYKKKAYFWHLAFLAIALLTKETAIIAPALCFVYAIIFVGVKKILADLKYYLYLLAGWLSLYLGWFLIRKAVLNNFIGNADYRIIPSILKNLPALIPAVGKIFLPFDLSVFPILQDMTMVYGIISLMLLGIWFIFSRNKNYRMIIFGITWFGLFILPTLIKPMSDTSDFNENRIYLPMLGFIFILLGMGRVYELSLRGLRLVRHSLGEGGSPACRQAGIYPLRDCHAPQSGTRNDRKKTILILGLLLIMVFSSVTVFRNKYYKNKINFWKNAVATSPSFAFNHNNLGAMYYLDGNYNLAEKEFKKALELNPREKLPHNNLGLIYAGRGDFENAIKEYEAELKINPYYGNALYNTGLAYWNMGKKDEAVKKWEETIAANPDYFDAYRSLIIYYQEKGDSKTAGSYYSILKKRGL